MSLRLTLQQNEVKVVFEEFSG